MWITKKRIYRYIIVLLIGAFCLPLLAGAQVRIENPLNYSTFSALLGNIAAQIGTLIAGLGVIMIIVAGILYLTSAGSPERIATAKKALFYAVAGIVIGASAQAIIEIVLGIMGASS